MESLDDEVESILYICREVSIYKIPPLKTNEGHRAQDWGDLAAPLWKGRLRIVEKSNATLMFEDATTGALTFIALIALSQLEYDYESRGA